MAPTDTARKLLATLDALPESERHEVFREVLRRAALSEHEAPSDDDLVAAADELFLALDREEKVETTPPHVARSGWSISASPPRCGRRWC